MSKAKCVLPVASFFIAAGRVLQLWRGGVPTVLQHIIRQVCEQLLQLWGKKKKKKKRKEKKNHMEMRHEGCYATKQ